MRLILNWKQSAKFATNWFHAAQVAVVSTWASLPADLKTYIPPKALMVIVGFIGVVGVIARMVDQSKAEAVHDEEAHS